MALDTSTIVIASLVVVIIMTFLYVAFRARGKRFELVGLNVDDLLKRVKESERLLQIFKNQPCWDCGGNEKLISGNLFEDNEIEIVCKACGTQLIWIRGKEWTLKTSTINPMKKLAEIVEKEKHPASPSKVG